MPKRDVIQNRLFKTIAFGVLTTALGLFTVLALINNSKEAKRRYDALIAVDSAGGDVETALRDLRSYIYSRMNTSIGSPNGVYPPIQLKGTYDRLVAAEQQKLAGSSTIYDQAQAYCESLYPGGQLRSSRVPCVTEYISARSGNAEPINIPDDQYKFDFVSPRWSPDVAGWALVMTIISGLVLIYNGVMLWHYRSTLRRSL